MQTVTKFGVLFALCLIVSSCSWFGKKDASTQPAKLKPFKQEVKLVRAWSRHIGDAARDNASKLVPALSGDRVFTASADGRIMALSADSGKVIWEERVQSFFPKSELDAAFAAKSDAIMGGVGAGDAIVVVGTFGGDLVAVNQSDGSLAWKAHTTSEVLAPPQIKGDLLVAQSIDGKVAAYNALDGKRLWVYSTTIPSLTLRGTSTPILTDSYVVAGFANGHVVLIDRDKGVARLDQRIAIPQGKSDLDRLVDVDGHMAIDNGLLFAASYQGNIAAIDLTQGRVVWTKPASTVAGVGVGFSNVYLSSFDGTITAYEESSGRVVWKTDALKNRNLTAPVTVSSYVAVGDFEGYMHLLAQPDGHIVGRVRVEHGPLTARFVVNGMRIYVQTRKGYLYAYDLR